ncbi:MAG: hypothetical protein ABSB12_02285 [Candidatus Saccharimonadales bacterium]
MERIKSISRKSILSGALLILILTSIHPSLIMAAKNKDNGSGSTNNASSQTPSTPNSAAGISGSISSGQSSDATGPNQPTGPSADTFTYDAATGLWENAYYTWNPVTDQTAPITPLTYSYDPTTGMWDTTQWVFDATTGQYVPNVVTVAQPPAGAITVNSPTTDTDNSSDTTGSSTTTNTPDANGDNTTNTPDANTTTGPSSTNNSNTNNNSNDFFGLYYNANISNAINENAQSGDATVTGNTLAGDATSGNVQDVANVINLLQSSASGISTFVANINGNVAGDLLLDPSTIIQPTSDSQQSTNTNSTTQVNSADNSTINNNVNLNADSGNANVTNNTSAGNATSGSADTDANIINLIDSDISSGQSFLGVINIYGDLDGNILLPPDFLNTLLASNAISDPVTASNGTTTTNVDNSNNDAINNSITNTANSGTASVNQNSSAGNATSGNATTNITVLNLTGSQIIGSNDLLVFVNVLGTWVGVIMDAPTGATAAELGSGITSDTTSANNSSTLNSSNNNTINNTVNENATSGDATVADNTTAGNATSGNASASVNLLNLIDSQLSVSNWFGILFINVFGTWDGSLGEETIPPPAVVAASSTPPASTSNTSNNSYAVIYSKKTNSSGDSNNSGLVSAILADANTNSGTHNLSKNILVSSRSNIIGSNANVKSHKTTSSVSIVALAIGFAGLILLGIERIWSNNKKRVKADVS